MLNKKQKVVIVIWMALILLSFLFPAWIRSTDSEAIWGQLSYSFFLDPPIYKSGPYYGINYKLMFLQMMIITLLTAGLILVFKDKKKDGGDV